MSNRSCWVQTRQQRFADKDNCHIVYSMPLQKGLTAHSTFWLNKLCCEQQSQQTWDLIDPSNSPTSVSQICWSQAPVFLPLQSQAAAAAAQPGPNLPPAACSQNAQKDLEWSLCVEDLPKGVFQNCFLWYLCLQCHSEQGEALLAHQTHISLVRQLTALGNTQPDILLLLLPCLFHNPLLVVMLILALFNKHRFPLVSIIYLSLSSSVYLKPFTYQNKMVRMDCFSIKGIWL